MARKITCTQCGELKPTPSEDALLGLFERRTHGALRASAYCDYCGTELNRGDQVIALTTPHDAAPNWEQDYLVIV